VLNDVLTVARREWKEYLLSGAGMKGGRAGLVVMLVVFGVVLPLQSGIRWITSPMLMAAWAWVPLMLVSGVIADSFAGERERHTLETLLATRLPDSTILLGKVTGAVVYAWGFTLALAILSLLSVNVVYWQGRPVLFPLGTALGVPVFSLLTAVGASAAGVLVSLRAATARQAAQMLSLAVMLLLFVPVFSFRALPPDARAVLAASLEGVSPRAALAGLAAALAVLDLGLLSLGFLRFRRARLILD
jgi:ABC-2 type transport system permease protein